MKGDRYSKDAAFARALIENDSHPDAGRTIRKLVRHGRAQEREIAALWNVIRDSKDVQKLRELVRERDAADLRALKAREEEQRLRDRLTRAGLSDKEPA